MQTHSDILDVLGNVNVGVFCYKAGSVTNTKTKNSYVDLRKTMRTYQTATREPSVAPSRYGGQKSTRGTGYFPPLSRMSKVSNTPTIYREKTTHEWIKVMDGNKNGNKPRREKSTLHIHLPTIASKASR